MAIIWFLKEGEIQVGPPKAEKPLEWCVQNLDLQPENWLAPLEQKNITIGQKTKLGEYRSFRFVLIEVNDNDLRGADQTWKQGFHLLDMDAQTARPILERSN